MDSAWKSSEQENAEKIQTKQLKEIKLITAWLRLHRLVPSNDFRWLIVNFIRITMQAGAIEEVGQSAQRISEMNDKISSPQLPIQ